MTSSTCFAFDLDGTVTTQELLPLIASELDLEREMRLLTDLTLSGTIPFEDSFRLRCAILRTAPLEAVRSIVMDVGIDPDIALFIQAHAERCFVVTGNLDVWVAPLIERLGCRSFTSQAVLKGGQLSGVSKVLRKSEPVLELRGTYNRVVAIGESFNDLPMFEAADVGVAFGGVHKPVPQLVDVADYLVYEGAALCRLLNTLL